MGTTRVKVFDLSGSEQEPKTTKKHARHTEISQPTNKVKNTDASLESEKAPEEEGQTNSDQPIEEAVKELSKPYKTKQKPKASTSKSTHHQGTNYQNAKKLVEDKNYSISEALDLLTKTSYTKFDPTVEIHLNVADKNIKGSVSFPFLKTKQKEIKYLIFSDKKIESPKIVIWANEKTVSDIEDGKLKAGRDFDSVITTPKFMPQLAKIAKILGPKGLMPSPKNGTITEDIEKILGSKVSTDYKFKTDPTGPALHTPVGKLSQKKDELEANMQALIMAIGPSKIKSATLTSTMSPSIKLAITKAQ